MKVREKRKKESIVSCLLGIDWRMMSQGKRQIKRTGILRKKTTEKMEKELSSAGWSLQVPPSNLHPTSAQQGTESPPPCASFFPAPRRGDLLSRRQMALPLPVLLWGLFPDGELEASLCCSSLPVQQPSGARGSTSLRARIQRCSQKTAAEPVRKINGFISRIFFLFEVSLLTSPFLYGEIIE